jgi:hypothetical protein
MHAPKRSKPKPNTATSGTLGGSVLPYQGHVPCMWMHLHMAGIYQQPLRLSHQPGLAMPPSTPYSARG